MADTGICHVWQRQSTLESLSNNPCCGKSGADVTDMMYTTKRLYVRHFGLQDLDDMAGLCADANVMRYVGDGTTLSREDVEGWIHICAGKYASRGYGTSAVFTRDHQFVGYCGVVRAPENDFDELIYVLHTNAWGQGYATEVAQPMLDYVFQGSVLAEIYATIDPANLASIKVAEKLGFRYARQEVDATGPVAFYLLRRDMWQLEIE
jgi:RimJ/RimL family protein N-acetyltransferase